MISTLENGVLHCNSCKQTVAGRESEKKQKWLNSKCTAVLDSISKQESIQLRRKESHSSHSLARSAAPPVWFCQKCGAVAVQRISHALGLRCPGVRSKMGRNNIQRIERGLFPGTSEAAKRWNKGRRM